MDYNRNLFSLDIQAACITLGCDFDSAAHTEAEIDQLYELWDQERLPMLEFAQKYICGGEVNAEGESGPGPESGPAGGDPEDHPAGDGGTGDAL